MSSTDSLFSLLNQLQLMEASLTDFMVETILRLQTLTEAKVFLLVESSGVDRKRRYCGTSELVRMYEGGALSQRMTDSMVELNPAVSADILVNRRSRKRIDSVGEGTNGLPSESYYTPPTKRKKSAGSATSSEMRGLDTDSLPLKMEATDCVVIDDEDDDLDGDADYATNDDVSHGQYALIPPQELSATQPVSGFFDALPAPHLEEQKLDAILKTDNPWAAYDKGKVEYKLWMSVLYNVGKNIALNCPFSDKSRKNDQVQAYFTNQCELFMSHCSAMIIDKDLRPDVPPPDFDGLRLHSVVGFIKHSIRHGYTHGIKKQGAR